MIDIEHTFYWGVEVRMQISPLQRGIYNHQANRIEKLLSSLKLPTRVQGGEVGREHIRYHLAPIPEIPGFQIREIASKVAEAMGVYKVQMDEQEDGWVLDLPQEKDLYLRLLPLIEEFRNLLPLTAVMGIAANGKPLFLNLRREETWHLLVYGPKYSGKSELLRTFILSLALKNKPSQVQFLGIDLTGKEITVIDALPHALSEVAIGADYAEEVIDWLAIEIKRRKESRVTYPDVVLVIDELESLMHHSEAFLMKLPLILEEGLNTGVHLVATSREIRPGSLLPYWQKAGMVIAKHRKNLLQNRGDLAKRGQFDFQISGERIAVQIAWLPAHDLQRAVRIVQMGWRSKSEAREFGEMWK
jgi:DNA segregation ATPase FtsK/SpoIIIE-like protein